MKYETNPKQSSGRGTESGDSRIDGERKTSLAATGWGTWTMPKMPYKTFSCNCILKDKMQEGSPWQTCAATSIEAFPISVPTGYADGRYEHSYR